MKTASKSTCKPGVKHPELESRLYAHMHWEIWVDFDDDGGFLWGHSTIFCDLGNCWTTPRVRTVYPLKFTIMFPARNTFPLIREICLLLNKRVLSRQGMVIVMEKAPFRWRKLTVEERVERALAKQR